MELNADSHTVSLPCPQCGEKFTQAIGWFKAHGHYTCGGCGASVTVDTTKFTEGIAEAQRALDDFRASIRKLGKR
jgi:predicted RNA-binding Zn-ribbon protein involved in translation (DUF1610 family)